MSVIPSDCVLPTHAQLVHQRRDVVTNGRHERSIWYRPGVAIQTIHHEGDSIADTATVWELLEDTMLWPTWTPIEQAQILERGDHDGVGERRTFKTGRVTVEERVTEKVPRRHYSYVLLGGLALNDYKASIELRDNARGGTHIAWHTTFEPRLLGTGNIYRRPLDKATRQFVDGLVREGERRAEAT